MRINKIPIERRTSCSVASLWGIKMVETSAKKQLQQFEKQQNYKDKKDQRADGCSEFDAETKFQSCRRECQNTDTDDLSDTADGHRQCKPGCLAILFEKRGYQTDRE